MLRKKQILYPTVALQVLSKEKPFLIRTIKYLMFEGVTIKDVLIKCKLFFRGCTTPIHVKFVEDPNTIDAGGPLREMFTLFYD